MKKIFLILALAAMSLTSAAQFDINSKMLGVGAGLGWSYRYGYSGESHFPSITLFYEQGFYDLEDVGTLSIGGLIGFQSSRYKNNSLNYRWNWTNTYAAAKAALHFNQVELFNDPKCDLYAGLSLGLRYTHTTLTGNYLPEEDYKSNDFGLMLNVFAGFRYYINPKFAAYAEVGYGISYLTLGVSYNL